MGERGMSDKESLRPAPPLSISLLIRILGDAVMSNLSLTFSCLSIMAAPVPGLEGVKQHLVLALGCVGCPEWRVIRNPELLADVLHINLHLLHCTVEDAFSLFHRKRNFFRHEVAIIYWNLGSNVLSRETGIHLPIFIPQSFCRPEWKPLQFCPNQRMRIATRLTKPVISFLAGS